MDDVATLVRLGRLRCEGSCGYNWPGDLSNTEVLPDPIPKPSVRSRIPALPLSHRSGMYPEQGSQLPPGQTGGNSRRL